MLTMGMREVRASADALEKKLAEAGEIVLTRHGRPFARVVPLQAPAQPTSEQARMNYAADPDKRRARLSELAAFRASLKFDPTPSEERLRAVRG